MVCNYCGTYIEENAKFCPKCGNMIEVVKHNEYQSPRKENYQNNSGNNNALVVALIVVAALLVLLISVVFAFMWMNNSDSSEEPTPTPMPTHTVAPVMTPTPTPTPIATPAPVAQHKVFKADVTWEQANQNALYDGGHLVYVNNAEEFGKVCALANSMKLRAFWLGASRASGQYWSSVRWGDGSHMNYTYWYKNEPTMYDENGNEERYLMAFNVDGIWYFNDSVNNVNSVYPGRIGYIVEYE